MNTVKIDVAESESVLTPGDLVGFGGSDGYHYLPLFPDLKYTDGVQYFARKAGAYWFLEVVASELLPFQVERGESFLNIMLAVKDSSAQWVVDDGNGNLQESGSVAFTDCPVGEWQFFLIAGVLLLPSEY